MYPVIMLTFFLAVLGLCRCVRASLISEHGPKARQSDCGVLAGLFRGI